MVNKLVFGLIFGIMLLGMVSAIVTVTLNSPADASTQYTNLVTLNATADSTVGLMNVTLYDNSTGTWGARNTTTLFLSGILQSNATEVSGSGSFALLKTITLNTSSYISKTYSSIMAASGAVTGIHEYNYANGTKVNVSSGDVCSLGSWIDFNSTNPNTEYLVDSIKIYLRSDNACGTTGAFYEKSTIVYGNQSLTSSNQTFTNTYTGATLWNVKGCEPDGTCEFATTNYTFSIDSTAPTIAINGGNTTQNYGNVLTNHTLNYTITDGGLSSCWLSYNGTNRTIPCTSGVMNTTNFTLVSGLYSATVWANDTIGNEYGLPITWDYRIFESTRVGNATSYETSYETFSISLAANSSLTAVYLNYNGTETAATNASGVWSVYKSIPTNALGNNSIYYRMVYAGSNINSITTYQNVSTVNISACNGVYTTKYINFTFLDEATGLPVNSQITSLILGYKLSSDSTISKTYTYSNTTEVPYYTFCGLPSDRTYYINYSISYKNGTTYPQRIAEISTTAFTNATTNTTLYLLSSTTGIYVTFQLTNSADQLLSGVSVNATRVIGSTTTTVAVGTTSSAGTVTFWLNPDAYHTFTFAKTGYTTYTYSDYPTQASYTVILSGGSTQTQYDYTKGITTTIRPKVGDLNNNTIYNFNLTLASSYWDVSEFGFTLRLANGTIIGSTSASTNGGIVSTNVNVSNYSRIYMNYYYVTNSTYTNNTIYWDTFDGLYTHWSIKTFFDDLDLYLDDGMFGIDDFGRYLIIFLILFLGVGIMGWKYGATSPTGIATILFAAVFFFDFILGLLPNPVGFIENSPTWLAAIILIGVILSENLR